MNNLAQFLYKQLHWIIFVILEVICFVLLFSYNSFQGSVYLSTANRATARLVEGKDKVTSYFGLAEKNKNLVAQNAQLQQRILELEAKASMLHLDSLTQTEALQRIYRTGYHVTSAQVVDKSINKVNNYLTINKGTSDGINPDMGVIGVNGIVGVVYKCSEHYSLILPLLNSKSSVSCKVMGSDYFGYLRWEGGDARYAMLYDLPRYSTVEIGDTIVTSGSSSFFPSGLPVGIVEEIHPSTDGLYVTLKVMLSTQFARLEHVFIMGKMDAEEYKELQESLKPQKKKKK